MCQEYSATEYLQEVENVKNRKLYILKFRYANTL